MVSEDIRSVGQAWPTRAAANHRRPAGQRTPSGYVANWRAIEVALYGLAAGAATAAAYAALSVASGREDFLLLVCVGFLVGLGLSYGPPWLSRVRLGVMSGLID